MRKKENYASCVELDKCLDLRNFGRKPVRKECFGTFRFRWNNCNRFCTKLHVRARTVLICLRI